MPRFARKIPLAPMPVKIPPMRNRGRLGAAVHADTTSAARSRMILGDPGSQLAMCRPAGGGCTMPIPKVRKIAALVSVGEFLFVEPPARARSQAGSDTSEPTGIPGCDTRPKARLWSDTTRYVRGSA